jgi:hypothetical protein
MVISPEVLATEHERAQLVPEFGSNSRSFYNPATALNERPFATINDHLKSNPIQAHGRFIG